MSELLLCTAVEVPRNISAPEFSGPFYTDDGYYFVCRIVYNESLIAEFDMALTVDGELSEVVKSVSSLSSLDANFTSDDAAEYFGKVVCMASRVLEIRTV